MKSSKSSSNNNNIEKNKNEINISSKNEIKVNSATYKTNDNIKKETAFKYINYKITPQEQKKEHKQSELYIDNCGDFGPNYEDITSLTGKQRIVESVSVTRNKERRKDPKWQNDNSIFKGIEHITFNFYEHGDEARRFHSTYDVLIKDNIDTISDDIFSKLKSFYFKSYSCHGAYYDELSCIFDELQRKIKNCSNKNVKCFASLIKKQYEMILGMYEETNVDPKKIINIYHKDNEIYTDLDKYREMLQKKNTLMNRIIRTPYKDKEVFDLDEIKQNKDKYFDYYYIAKDNIYKIPNSFVKNRVDLIDNDKFEEEFKKLNLKPIDIEKEFKEYYSTQKNIHKNKERKNISRNVNTNKIPRKRKSSCYSNCCHQ